MKRKEVNEKKLEPEPEPEYYSEQQLSELDSELTAVSITIEVEEHQLSVWN